MAVIYFAAGVFRPWRNVVLGLFPLDKGSKIFQCDSPCNKKIPRQTEKICGGFSYVVISRTTKLFC